jgi:anti-sigma factor RsiW
MRCKDFQERWDELWEGVQTTEIQRHLAECKECGRYVRDMQVVRSGFSALKRESVPEPSLGFSERLVRRLGELSEAPSVSGFFESVGRRFVYATLALTFLMLLALGLPSAGPVRGLAATDVLMPTQETAQVQVDPLGESSDVPDAMPGDAPALPVTKGMK